MTSISPSDDSPNLRNSSEPEAVLSPQKVAQYPIPTKSKRTIAPTELTIESLVRDAFTKQASDIHLRVGDFPRYRIRGQIVPQIDHQSITPKRFEQFLSEMLTPEQRDRFRQDKELDTAIYYPGFLRCRVNCFQSLSGGAIVLRLISLVVPSIDHLGLPPVMKHLVSHAQGLILVTGPTGSGKSTSIAAMIRELNVTDHRHIVTIEDPIEYVHPSKKCLISQREVGLHTHEFHQALRAVLREDPDVILIGEIRDRVTVDTALKAAQTGHLVLGTLHTKSAIATINRLLNFYNLDEQPAMRLQLLESLIAVISQRLLPTTDGGRTAAHEILINTPAMQDYLLKGNDIEAFHLMETDTNDGMQVINQVLCDLILEGRVTPDDAVKASPDLGDLRRRVRNEGFDPGRSSHREFDPFARAYNPA